MLKMLLSQLIERIKRKLNKYRKRFHLYKNWVNLPNIFAFNYLKRHSRCRIYRLNKGLRAKITGLHSIKAVFASRDYKELVSKIGDTSTVIDIGANIGIFSIYATTLAKRGRVYAYEPHPTNFQFLCENIRINRLENRVMPFQCAVAGNTGERELFIAKRIGEHSLFGGEGIETITVNTTTLKDILEQNGVSGDIFIKIDCEGAEYEILHNTPPEYFDGIKAIGGEYHMIDDGRLWKSLRIYLSGLGFTVDVTKVSKSGKRGLFYAYKGY